MIEQIKNRKQLLSIIIRANYKSKGIEFLHQKRPRNNLVICIDQRVIKLHRTAIIRLKE